MKQLDFCCEPEQLADVLAKIGQHIGSFRTPSPDDAEHLAKIILAPTAPTEADREWLDQAYRAYSHCDQDTVGWPVTELAEVNHLRMRSFGDVLLDVSVEEYEKGPVCDVSINFGRDSISLAKEILDGLSAVLPGRYTLRDQYILYYVSAARYYLAEEGDTPAEEVTARLVTLAQTSAE